MERLSSSPYNFQLIDLAWILKFISFISLYTLQEKYKSIT